MKRIATLIVLLLTIAASVATAAEPLAVKVMSFNIRYGNAKDGENHWDKRKDTVVQVFRDVSADFVGGQEALPFQIEYIREVLGDQYAVLYRTREVDEAAGEASPIFYRGDRWQLDRGAHGTFWLSDTPEQPGSTTWGNRLPRIVTWGRFIDRRTGRAVYVYNTHFDHQSQESRVQAAGLMLQRMRDRGHKDEPIIVMGDFNAGEDNPASVRLRQGPPELVDTFRVVHPEATQVGTFGGFKGGRDGQKIDHIYVEPGVKVKSAEILHQQVNGRWPSDHYPVTAEIEFPGR